MALSLQPRRVQSQLTRYLPNHALEPLGLQPEQREAIPRYHVISLSDTLCFYDLLALPAGRVDRENADALPRDSVLLQRRC